MDLFINIVESDKICVIRTNRKYDVPNIPSEQHEYYGYFNIEGIVYKLLVSDMAIPDTKIVPLSKITRKNSSLVLIRALKYLEMCDGPKKPQFLTEMDKLDFQLNEPYNYHSQLPGKEIRLKFIDILSEKFYMKPQLLTNLKYVTSLFHNVSLLIDDIQDEGKLRRGKPCAYMKYGSPLTINCAYYQMFACWSKIPILFDELHEETTKLVIDSLLILHQGQGYDILWRDNRICPTINEYISMIEKKTSEAFVLIVRLFFLHSTSFKYNSETLEPDASLSFSESSPEIQERIINLARLYGIYFQINDDYINITSEDFSKLKGLYDDIYERKYSYLVVYIINKKRKGYEELEAIFASPNKITELQAKRCIELIKGTDAISHTKRKLKTLTGELVANVSFDISELIAIQK